MSSDAGAGGREPTGIVYDIQGFSVHDGPGIRTTVFLKGCPLRCPWCHSPESQRFDIQLSWQWRKCIGTELCGTCLSCCPRGAIMPDERTSPDSGIQLIQVDWETCDDCGACVEQCPAGALSLWGKEYAVSEVIERVLRDRPFFERSGGGVTISGGEPLSQPEFTLALLEALRAEGIDTALDTTALAPWAIIKRALPHVGLFLVDLKQVDSRRHKAAVGVPNELILENIRRLAAAGGKLQVRMPVIPKFSDSKEDCRAAGTFLRELGRAVTVVQLLPYHSMGVPKWERIKHTGPILEAAAPPDQLIGELQTILEGYGLRVQVH